jgi:hypothetical protein
VFSDTCWHRPGSVPRVGSGRELSGPRGAAWIAFVTDLLPREHDRHCAGCLQQWSHGRGASGQDDVRSERGQFCRVSANVGGIGRGPAGIDAHVAADDPAQLRQRLQERSDPGLKFRVVRGCGQLSRPRDQIPAFQRSLRHNS